MTFNDHTSPRFNASVERTAKDSVRISWQTRHNDTQVRIYRGNTPEIFDRKHPLLPIAGERAVEISGLNPDMPHYFEIVFEDNTGIIIGERRLPLEGTVNFRDLGGYQTCDGRRIRWGKVFRSDHLSRLTDRDIDFMRKLKIQFVCDFRTSVEARNRPDRFPGDSPGEYLHLPINHLKFDPTTLFEKLKRGDTSWLTKEFLIEGYLSNIDKFASIWGRVFKRLADPGHMPLVFHCTGGKDRAGTCAALILLALGVPEETVVYDHGLSNIFIADVVNEIYAQFDCLGIDREKISPYFSAPRYCIEAMIGHLNEKYGSPTEYLKSKAGVTAEMLESIKKELLQ
jgi:protein-tyrosine phosphatase